ncbi:hypothetical protein BGX28_006659 [Mortierella sp. GBA30]|nr:hypothetical protein BGX28_006659 [Mortierella sp. GBA30]
MKFNLLSVASLAFATIVAAQQGGNSTNGGGSGCMLCLQNSLMALPLCKGLNITVGEFNPGLSPEYAVCLCSSLNGTWIDACKDPSVCGPDIESFKNAYAENMQQAGLQCNGTKPTFIPPPADPVASTSASGTSPTQGAGNKSFAHKGAVPSILFMEVMGAFAVMAAVGASLL